MRSLPGENRALVAGVVGTTASAMPAFLTGAVAVQLTADIGLDDRTLGFCIGLFFAGAATGSAVLGRLAERLGGSGAMRTGLSLTLVAGLSLAALARSPLSLGLLLLAAGTSNALTQPAANLLLVERMQAGRMGFAFAIKQAGMPMASLIGGVLVPAVAVTVGWRWAYVIAGGVAVLALLALPPNRGLGRSSPGSAAVTGGADVRSGGADPVTGGADMGSGGADPGAGAADVRSGGADPGAGGADVRSGGPAGASAGVATRRRPDLGTGLLVFYNLIGLLGASAAGALTSFLVTAAEAAGVAEGPAGLLLTVGSAVGITSRIVHGRLADGPRLLPIRRVLLLFAIGAVGMAILALDRPVTYLVGMVPVFGAGWAWPGLFNLSVVRNNPSAPAAATGISQTGIYVGAAAGPVLGGLVADTWGYPALWLLSGAVLLVAAALGQVLRLRLRRRR